MCHKTFFYTKPIHTSQAIQNKQWARLGPGATVGQPWDRRYNKLFFKKCCVIVVSSSMSFFFSFLCFSPILKNNNNAEEYLQLKKF